MDTLIRNLLMAVFLGLLGGCAYDPVYPSGSSSSYYGGSSYGNPYTGYSGYSNGYRNGYYNTGSPGYGNGRYCPDDDDD